VRNLDEHNITIEVLRRIKDTPNVRLKEIMTRLVQHMHDFARETKLTEEEWSAGIDFLGRTGQLCTPTRQEFVLLSDTLGLSQLVVAQSHSRPKGTTEQTVFGPFHIEGAPSRRTHGSDISVGVSGEPLYVTSRVISDNAPVLGALVDVWHADARGEYDVQGTNWTIEQARLRATIQTDEDGRFSFKTIMPKSYPIPTDGTVGEMMQATCRSPMRPAHIHFRVKKLGFDPLITHVFVDGDEFLDSDAVFGVRGSCIGNYALNPPGATPFGDLSARPYYTLDYCFSLHPLTSTGPSSMWSLEI
jgi:hydroxyquinol 1,2-dioxygenase